MKKTILFILICGCVSAAALSAQLEAESGFFTDGKRWAAFDDKNDSGTSSCRLTAGPEEIDGQSRFVVSMTGTVTADFQYGFIGILYKLNAAELADIARAAVIKFKALGDGKDYKCRLDTTDVADYDNHLFVFSTTAGRVVEIEIPFSSFAQEGWGRNVEFIIKNIVQLAFQTVGQPHESIALKVFDFRLE